MKTSMERLGAWGVTGLVAVTAGCVVAAAGAGAGGGIHFTQRGVESVVAAPLERAFSATKRAFEHFGIRQTKVEEEAGHKDEGAKREVSGETADRDVVVALKAESKSSTRVQVVARKSAVTWDKDFARAILERVVAFSK